ncbi:hypothetical protein LBMAG53_35930 [Planctomycetota bacterium]|nr:hypothetical protein LBMAG53_35930 [Planctomycetota bacterium]
MDWPAAAVATAAARLRLGLDPRRRRQGAGTRLGQGPGASLEFHDHRAYAPGDDLRQLDWKVYARSGSLVLRRHRVEVAPRLEILLDGSASMAQPPAKAALAAALTALLCTLAESDGLRPHLWLLGDQPHQVGGNWRIALGKQVPAGAGGLEAATGAGLMPGAERVLISDGLCVSGGPAVVRRLGAGAGRICLIQVMSRSELDPAALGAVHLMDVEGGASDQLVDPPAVAAYRQRLARHQAGWHQALAGRGAGVAGIAAEDGLDAAIRRLLANGIVAMR